MDIAHVRGLLLATLDANADTRRHAELQLKQVRQQLFGLGERRPGGKKCGLPDSRPLRKTRQRNRALVPS